MLPPPNPREDRFEGLWPVEHDHLVGEPHRQVAEFDELSITEPIPVIPLLACVKFTAVALENETIADDEVHASDTRDAHLHRHSNTQGTQAESNKSLGARLASTVRPAECPSVAPGESFERGLELSKGDKPLVQRRVDHDHRVILGLALHCIDQRVDDRRNAVAGRITVVAPV